MAKDIKIVPSVNRIEFTGSSTDTTASIELDNMGRLVLSSSQVLFGDGSSNDVYMGDGSGSTYVVFDQNGGIKGEAGTNTQVTLGSSDTRIKITGSEIVIDSAGLTIDGPDTLELPPITSSFATIASGSFTGSFKIEDGSATSITASDLSATNITTTNLTASGIQLPTGSAIHFTGSDATKGGSVSLDGLGNLILDSVSGSVFLSKDNGDIFIGDGTSSANIVFDFDGAIKGEDGQSVNLTLGSTDTVLYITGSSVTMGAYTASSALIQGGVITASAAVIGDVEIENDSINIANITSSIISSSVSITTNQGNFINISASSTVSASKLNVPVTGELLFTGSDASIGGKIALDAVGNLVFSTVSGSISLGDGSNNFYVGDGTASANMIFDAGGTIKADTSQTLVIGSSDATLQLTGSNFTIQNGGGAVNLGSSVTATGSFNGTFDGMIINTKEYTLDTLIPANSNALLVGEVHLSGSITIPTNSTLKII